MQPSSVKRLCWEFVALLLIFFDILVVPLQLLDPPDNKFMSISLWITRIFWTIDIIVSFFTGYISHNAQDMTEIRFSKVAKRYARTRLPFDFILVASDWMEVVVNALGGPTALRLVVMLRAV